MAAIAVTLLVKDAYAISVINLIAIGALTAASVRFVLSFGALNMATTAFVALGAYGTGIATTILHWPFPLPLLFGVIGVIAVSIAFGFLTLRTAGVYFVLIGFAFSEAVRIVFSKTLFLGGNSGMTGIYPPRFMEPWLAAFVMAVVVVLLFALYAIEKSYFGKVLYSIRDNENLAKSVGVNVVFCKVTCFVIASFCAGVAGGLQAFMNSVISPSDFGFLVTAFALAYLKVGGEKSMIGVISGSIILVSLGSFALGLGAAEQMFYGGVIVLCMLLLQEGLTGLGFVKKALRKLSSVRLEDV